MVIKEIQFTFIELTNVHRLNMDLTRDDEFSLSCNSDVGVPRMTISREEFHNMLKQDLHNTRQHATQGGIRLIFDDGSEEQIIIK